MATRLIYEKVGAIADMTQIERDRYDKALTKLNRQRKAQGKKGVQLKVLLRKALLTLTADPKKVLDMVDYDDNN
jgi:hypothetical protein